MTEAKECFNEAEVEDICMSGFRFTWNQSPGRKDGLLKKLDRVMANDRFVADFPLANAVFLPFLKSDHCPMVLVIPEVPNQKHKPFKFPNYLVHKAEFLPIAKKEWDYPLSGVNMFRLVTHLKRLKKDFRKLNYQQGNLFENVIKLKAELESIQEDIVNYPENEALREEELVYLNAYSEAVKDEERFLQQKAKVLWLKEGDHNSKYFHKVVKGNNNRNRIHQVEDLNGNSFTGNQVGTAFVNHFEVVLGISTPVAPIRDPQSLFSKQVNTSDVEHMVKAVTSEEIKEAMFDIEDLRAPGPDGYSSKFFKASWNVVGPDVCKAIKGFFHNGKLLKEVNTTVIALVPKLETPCKVSDYRPIACCNVVYKCNSKILANRIKQALVYAVNENQCAFIPGRQISDNILITQELMRNYHRMRGQARCAFKIDIQKAYDTVEWEFLQNCLFHFGFPKKMIDWIMTCVTTASFSIAVNGDHKGFFKGKRGLRQGDPLSPYLFTLVMEVLTLMITRRVKDDEAFKYHWRCKEVDLTHLCFADDLFLFCHGDTNSVYWASVFIIPLSVSKEIEKLFRGFLWCHGEMKRGKAKVKWKEVCTPMLHGGLGLKLLRTWNQALISKHTWNIISRKDSLWVKWILAYRLKHGNFWEFESKVEMCWGWRKILEFRSSLRDHIIHKIGNGQTTSAWFDNWHPLGPLSSFLSHRNMCEGDFSRRSKVADIVSNGMWKWPQDWQERFLNLYNSQVIDISDVEDKIIWKTNEGNLIQFTVGDVWMDIREEGAPVPWFSIVWFSQNIPRHAFILWLAIKGRLKTHEVLSAWMDTTHMKCVLCKTTSDSHNHLFFACPYSKEIWNHMKVLTKWGNIPSQWSDIIIHMCNNRSNNSIWSIVNRLTLGAAVYYVWQERNRRTHEQKSRPVAEIIKLIREAVRLRILGLKLKKTAASLQVAKAWDLHNIQRLVDKNPNVIHDS
ncbi:uncharacterized protein LOC110926659 [Helianthus annuus]|uniref:uncharacterized protein LOC110926659 n=1 Tax=Helianthus annuus TaxID=4232 RepID=UPI000B8F7EBD|nr:uncharacterized protein LOC110926659 [Helianthus annuus]